MTLNPTASPLIPDPYTYWIPSKPAVLAMLELFGFEIVGVRYTRSPDRLAVLARSRRVSDRVDKVPSQVSRVWEIRLPQTNAGCRNRQLLPRSPGLSASTRSSVRSIFTSTRRISRRTRQAWTTLSAHPHGPMSTRTADLAKSLLSQRPAAG